VALVAVLATLLLPGAAGSTGAARAATSERPKVQIALSKDAYWYDPEGTAILRVTLDNKSSQTIKGVSLRVRAFAKNSARSDLDQSIDGKPGKSSLFTETFERDSTLKPGTNSYSVEMPLSDHGLGDGVYPLEIAALNSGTALASTVTELVVMSKQDGADTRPLKLSVVFDLAEPPHCQTSGSYGDDELAAECSPDVHGPGWFSTLQSEADKWQNLHLSFSLSPLLADEMTSCAGGYTVKQGAKETKYSADSTGAADISKVNNTFKQMAAQQRFQFLNTPYTSPDMERLWALGWRDDLKTQISRGQKVLDKYLDDKLASDYLFPPAMRANTRVLAGLSGQVGKYLVLGPELLDRSSQGKRFLKGYSLTSPVAVNGKKGAPKTALFADSRLQELATRLAPSHDPHGVTQALVSELTNLYLERPSRDRVSVLAWPSSWRPPRAVFDEIMKALAVTPWVQTVTVGEVVFSVPQIQGAILDIPAAPGSKAEDDYFALVAGARRSLQAYSEAVFRGNPNIAPFTQNLMVAESDIWRQYDLPNKGARFAGAVRESVQTELAKVTLPAMTDITLTSERAKIPVTAINSTGYEVKATLVCTSNGLSFPSGAARRVTLAPKENIFEVGVKVKKTGRVQFTARLDSGGTNLGTVDVSVRTGTFSSFAIMVVAGLLGVILLFWGMRMLRRRKVGKHKRGQLGTAEEEG